jgi:uroporphyrinogen decarboxylase
LLGKSLSQTFHHLKERTVKIVTSRERVLQSLRCQRPDKVPKALGFFPQSLDEISPNTPEDYFHLDVRFLEFHPPEGQDDFLVYLETLPRDVHIGSMAQLQTYNEWDYHPERGSDHPLNNITSIEELTEYVFPDLTNPTRYDGLSKQVEIWHSQEFAVAGSPPHLGGELFEMAKRLRGFNNFMVDLVQRKKLAHYLLDQLTDILIHNALILTQTGIDILLLDDDIAMPTQLIISPTTWREFFKPRLAHVIRIVKEESPDLLVFYHSDGDFTRLIPELVEIGVNVINPVQPDCMNALAIKQEFGGDLAMWGTVGSAELWDYGTPNEIRQEVNQRITSLGPEGLLLSPAYDIDFAPFENIVAFIEATEEFGCF